MPARFSQQDFLAVMPKDYQLIGQFINTATKVKVRHTKCGHEWEVWPRNLTRGSGCPHCWSLTRGAVQTLSHAEFAKRVKAKFGPDVKLLSNYVTMKERVLVQHKCGRTHSVIADNLLAGQCCAVCNKRKRHELTLGSRTVLVDGFEPDAIAWLLSQGIKADEILTEREGVPRFQYRFKNGVYGYRPDLLVKSKTIVEVKSEITAGLLGDFYSKPAAYLYYSMRAKAKSVNGEFEFRLLIMSKTTKCPLRLPKNWTSLSHTQFKREVKKLNYTK